MQRAKITISPSTPYSSLQMEERTDQYTCYLANLTTICSHNVHVYSTSIERFMSLKSFEIHLLKTLFICLYVYLNNYFSFYLSIKLLSFYIIIFLLDYTIYYLFFTPIHYLSILTTFILAHHKNRPKFYRNKDFLKYFYLAKISFFSH